ncbi:MAG: hypothetical protein OXK21_06415, partial [Chloroflexota bacterium]|nr:hypothetical protein [Chloroflexota bacterium]
KGEPSTAQIGKYALDGNAWAIVSLTKGKLPQDKYEALDAACNSLGKRFCALQWWEILRIVLHHQRLVGDEPRKYLFDEFVRYIRRDYNMGYYDAEVYIQDVNYENASVFFEGWIYIDAPNNKADPLYFAPYLTWRGVPNSDATVSLDIKQKGISHIGRVLGTEVHVPARLESSDISAALKAIIPEATDEQLEHWCRGHELVRHRLDYPRLRESLIRFVYMAEPVLLPGQPLTKSKAKRVQDSLEGQVKLKKLGSQINPSFSLRFDELLHYQNAS